MSKIDAWFLSSLENEFIILKNATQQYFILRKKVFVLKIDA